MAMNALAVAGLSAVVLAGVGGGLAAASENAVPGDLLYGFKTNVNEGVMVGLSGSADSRAEAEVRLAERRIEEFNQLQADGNLEADVRARIEAEIDEHLANARQHVASIEAEGNTEAAVALRAQLDTVLSTFDSIDMRLDDEADSSVSMSAAASMAASATASAGTTMSRSQSQYMSAGGGAQGSIETHLETSGETHIDTSIESRTETNVHLSN